MSRGINVLSLCDGMSCGQITINKINIKIKDYYASEIKDIAIKVTKDNYPNTIHIGDMTKVSYKNGVLYTEKGAFQVGGIDLIIGGSPCQNLSIAMNKKHRVGLKGDKSILFWEYLRILKEVKPKYFLLENVARMPKEDMDIITNEMGVTPIRINSKLLSAQLRDRLYWTNIPNVKQPDDKHILLKDIITSGYVDREKSRALLVSDSRPLTTKSRMIHRYRSTGFTTLVFEDCGNDESCRYFNQTELERLQTVPEGYTSCLTRNQAADVLGDGWTVDVIAHILNGLKEELSIC